MGEDCVPHLSSSIQRQSITHSRYGSGYPSAVQQPKCDRRQQKWAPAKATCFLPFKFGRGQPTQQVTSEGEFLHQRNEERRPDDVGANPSHAVVLPQYPKTTGNGIAVTDEDSVKSDPQYEDDDADPGGGPRPIPIPSRVDAAKPQQCQGGG